MSSAVIARLKANGKTKSPMAERDSSARQYVDVWADGVDSAGAHRSRTPNACWCADRRDAGGQEGVYRLLQGDAGERAERRNCSSSPEAAPWLWLSRRKRHRRWACSGLESPLDAGASRRPSTSDAGCTRRATCSTRRSRSTQRAQQLRETGCRAEPGRGKRRRRHSQEYAPKYDKAVECLIKDRQTPRRSLTFPPIIGTFCEPRPDRELFER